MAEHDGITDHFTGPKAQSVASPIADPGVAISIPARSHTFAQIDHEIISTVILLLPLNQEGLLSITSESMSKLAQEKVWLGELTVLT